MEERFSLKDYIAHLLIFTFLLVGSLSIVIFYAEHTEQWGLFAIDRQALLPQTRALYRGLAFSIPLLTQSVCIWLVMWLVPFRRKQNLLYLGMGLQLLMLLWAVLGLEREVSYPVFTRVYEGMQAPEALICLTFILLFGKVSFMLARKALRYELFKRWIRVMLRRGEQRGA